MRIGIHTSIAGSLESAALKAHELGANTFQIFSTSPRMWRASIPDAGDIRRLRAFRERHDLAPLAIHANYLINLASADAVIRRRSITAFRGELDRALAIGADYLVLHPGSAKDQARDEAIALLSDSLAAASEGVCASRLMLLLENTAGAGSALGSRLEELSFIARLARRRVGFAVGYCLDTCHLLSAGYDIATAAGLRHALSEADRVLGLDRVRVIHANDSKAPLGSHLDRHEHIGKGYIGKEAFRRILRHPKLRRKAFILETPVENEGDDHRNIATLKRLCRRSPTSKAASS